jgi:FAD:protein FMN transferase
VTHAPEADRQDLDGLLRFSARALGSALRLAVRLPETPGVAGGGQAAGPEAAASAWREVRAEFDAVDAALSRFRDDSELTMLNRLAGSGQVVEVSWRTRRALAAIDRAGRITGGRFDASVLGALERIGEQGASLGAPGSSPGAPGAATRVAPPADRPPVRVHVPAVPVDMGGIGKGLALRWAAARAAAVLPAGSGLLLEAGGDLVAHGVAPVEGWRVGIEDPAAATDDADPLVVVETRGGAVATSSVRVRNWVAPDGRAVHHLLDPRTGEPARTGLIAVTVAAPDPAWAEVWTKALFLAGRDGIADEARARGMAAWWVDERGRLGMTPEARIRTAWAAEHRLG